MYRTINEIKKKEMKDKKEPEYMMMRRETVDLSIISWLCSTHVGSSLDVNLRLFVNCFEIGLINLTLGGIQNIIISHTGCN